MSAIPDTITERNNDPTTVMMASCICALIFDLTSEEYLLSVSNLDRRTLESLSQLIAKSFSQVIHISQLVLVFLIPLYVHNQYFTFPAKFNVGGAKL